jgi:molybdopterin/thiamine biosynthesis adenylyltransferase
MTPIRTNLTDFEKELFHRSILIPEVGEKGQLKLLESSVLIVGLGGLGSPALSYLTACGVGKIGIADGDRVELSNLQRQILHGREDIGSEKTASAARSATRLRPEVRLKLYSRRISAANAAEIIDSYDFVIEATDDFASKFLISDACVRLGKAYSHAGILGMWGQTMTVIPGRGPCYRCVFGDVPSPGAIPTAVEVGVLGVVPGVLGAIQAAEAIKYLLNCGSLLVGRLLTWDALSMTFREISLPPGASCVVCEQNQRPKMAKDRMEHDHTWKK